jgi:chromosome segregation ATPase
MSDVLDLTLVLRNTERAARAAEAALTVAQRLENDISHRMSAMEARFSSLEGRVPAMIAGLNTLTLDVNKLNDKLLDHDGRFDVIERRLLDHHKRFDAIDATLAAILARLPS